MKPFEIKDSETINFHPFKTNLLKKEAIIQILFLLHWKFSRVDYNREINGQAFQPNPFYIEDSIFTILVWT